VEVSDDGKRLGLRLVNNKVISNDNKDSETIQKLVEKNLQNPNCWAMKRNSVRKSS
jgi:hypothetical protein